MGTMTFGGYQENVVEVKIELNRVIKGRNSSSLSTVCGFTAVIGG